MYKNIISLSLLLMLGANNSECSWLFKTNSNETDKQFIERMKKTPHVKAPDHVYGIVDYLNYGITKDEVEKTALSHEVKKTLRNMPTIQKGLQLAQKDFNVFLHTIPLEYPDEMQIQDVILDAHENALQAIRSGIEPQLSQILIESINSKSEILDTKNLHKHQILEYVTTHKEFRFQVPEVVEYMIDKKDFKEPIVNFLLENVQFIKPVNNINQNCTKHVSTTELNETIAEDPILAYAVKSNNLKAAKLLLAAGANVHLPTKHKIVDSTKRIITTITTPILIPAILNNNLEAIKLLLTKGADVHSQLTRTISNKNTQTEQTEILPLLGQAIEEKNLEVIKLLRDHGADVNSQTIVRTMNHHIQIQRTKTGSLLSYAIANKNLEAIKLLLANGADVHQSIKTKINDVEGEMNLIEFALQEQGCDEEIIQLLVFGCSKQASIKPVNCSMKHRD